MNMFLQPPPPSQSPVTPSAPSVAPMFGMTSPATSTSPPAATSLPPQPLSPVSPILQPPVPVSPPVGLPPTFDPFAQMASPPPQHQGPGAVVGPPTNLPVMAPPVPTMPSTLPSKAPSFLAPASTPDPDDAKNEADLTAEYIDLRNKKAEQSKAFKEQLEPIETRMEEIEGKMLARLQRGGVESFKTTAGTAFKKLKTYYNVEDPEQLVAWTEQTGNVQVLKRDIRQDEVRTFMDENGYVPPGIKVTSEFVVQFRK